MKLNTQQIDEVQRQTGADPIPEDHPVMDELKTHFGDHTFYVDRVGLHVWETLGEAQEDEEQPATAVTVASWTDDQRTSLRAHEPKPTAVIVKLNPQESGSGEPGGDSEEN